MYLLWLFDQFLSPSLVKAKSMSTLLTITWEEAEWSGVQKHGFWSQTTWLSYGELFNFCLNVVI